MKIKRIFFPFYKKYPQLDSKWWHRLSLVVFFVSLVFVFFFIHHDLITSQEQRLSDCIDRGLDDPSNRFIHEFPTGAPVDLCDLYEVNYSENLLIALIIVFIASYILQLLYFKILLYVIYGKKLEELKLSS